MHHECRTSPWQRCGVQTQAFARGQLIGLWIVPGLICNQTCNVFAHPQPTRTHAAIKRITNATRRFAPALVITLIVLLSLLPLSRWLQPEVDGKTFDEWVSSLPLMVDPAGNESFNDEKLLELVTQVGIAIRQFGPNDLYRLERELRATDSRFGLARYHLEVQWMNALRRDPTYVPAAFRRARAISALSELGPVGAQYINELRFASTNVTENQVVRGHARWALEKIAPRSLPREEHRWCKITYGWCGFDTGVEN